MRYRFVIVDVFSNTPFGGNQLAVLTDARGISDAGMQAITREFNFAETTFVLPARDPSCSRRVRIFTPGRELPFAGHPTVGTACVLVREQLCPAGKIRLEEAIGPVDVDVTERQGMFVGTLRVQQEPAVPDEVPPAAKVAEALSVTADEVERVFCAGLGVNFTFVQLGSREAVDRARLNTPSWEKHLAGTFGPQLFIYAGQLKSGGELYGRMFAEALGIREDPATGSAVGALVGVAPAIAGIDADVFTLNVVQGVAMGRPSVLTGVAHFQDGAVKSIEVGGSTAFTVDGEIEVPAACLTGGNH